MNVLNYKSITYYSIYKYVSWLPLMPTGGKVSSCALRSEGSGAGAGASVGEGAGARHAKYACRETSLARPMAMPSEFRPAVVCSVSVHMGVFLYGGSFLV